MYGPIYVERGVGTAYSTFDYIDRGPWLIAQP
jgi:hypothetical protein